MELEIFDDFKNIPKEDIKVEKRPYLIEVRSTIKHKIPKYPMFIGREKNKVSVCIPISCVSRRHAKVFEKDGVFYIQDLGSINGTFVNEQRILDPVALKNEDRIKIGITMQYPEGAREFTFKIEDSLEQQQEKEAAFLLQEAGITAQDVKPKLRGILLKDCIVKVAKKDIMSVIIASQFKRVPINKIDIKSLSLEFYSLTSFKVKDMINCVIEHPKMQEKINIILRIINIADTGKYGILLHKASIVKIAEKHKKTFEEKIKSSLLIDYATSQLKE